MISFSDRCKIRNRYIIVNTSVSGFKQWMYHIIATLHQQSLQICLFKLKVHVYKKISYVFLEMNEIYHVVVCFSMLRVFDC